MPGFVTRIVLLSLAVIACTAPGSDSDSARTAGDAETGKELSAQSTSATVPSTESGLIEDFLALVYPIEYSNLRSSAQVYEAPLYSGRLMVACLANSGFRTLAQAFEAAPPTFFDDAWLFPNMERLAFVADAAMKGDLPDDPPPPWVLLNWVTGSPHAVAGVEGIRTELESNPQWGTAPAQAEALFEVLASCQAESRVQDPQPLLQAQLLRSDWIATLRGYEPPQLETAMGELMECLQDVHPMFQHAATPTEWWAEAGSHLDPLFALSDSPEAHQALALINSGYVACMEPMLEVRQPVWASLRSARIEENLFQLLELQSALHRLLDDL